MGFYEGSWKWGYVLAWGPSRGRREVHTDGRALARSGAGHPDTPEYKLERAILGLMWFTVWLFPPLVLNLVQLQAFRRLALELLL
jgi:hypothetical protein